MDAASLTSRAGAIFTFAMMVRVGAVIVDGSRGMKLRGMVDTHTEYVLKLGLHELLEHYMPPLVVPRLTARFAAVEECVAAAAADDGGGDTARDSVAGIWSEGRGRMCACAQAHGSHTKQDQV